MKHSEVEHIVRGMMIGAQRARSILSESLDGHKEPQDIEQSLSPWLYGHKSILPTLIDAVDKLERHENFEQLTFMNLLLVCDMSPAIVLCALAKGYTIPSLAKDEISMEDIFGEWEV